jgi:hypothetical protein
MGGVACDAEVLETQEQFSVRGNDSVLSVPLQTYEDLQPSN